MGFDAIIESEVNHLAVDQYAVTLGPYGSTYPTSSRLPYDKEQALKVQVLGLAMKHDEPSLVGKLIACDTNPWIDGGNALIWAVATDNLEMTITII